MTDLERLRLCRSGCLSPLDLDRLARAEADSETMRRSLTHLPSCEHCRAGLKAASQGFEACEELQRDKVLNGIVAGLADIENSPSRDEALSRLLTAARGSARLGEVIPLAGSAKPSPPRFRAAALVGALSAAAAAVLAVFWFQSSPPRLAERSPEDAVADVLTVKGGLGLNVYRDRKGVDEQVSSGAAFSAGDRLRFSIDLPRSGHVRVVGLESRGVFYPVHPAGETAASMAMTAAQGLLLPTAIELDDSTGVEWLFLVLCDRSFSLRELSPGQRPGEIAVPAGCQQTGFAMNKAGK